MPAVLIELERRRAEVTYVRTPDGYEVDFLARYPEGRMELIQVCADASSDETAARELRALDQARMLFPEAQAVLLTATQTGLPPALPSNVTAKPAYVWLLHSPEAPGA